MQEFSIREELFSPVSFNVENPRRCECKLLEKVQGVKYNVEFLSHFLMECLQIAQFCCFGTSLKTGRKLLRKVKYICKNQYPPELLSLTKLMIGNPCIARQLCIYA